MIAAMGTLVFLATMWLLVVVGAAVLEESGAKIAAALRGKPDAKSPAYTPLRIRSRMRQPLPMRAPAKWRAAA